MLRNRYGIWVVGVSMVVATVSPGGAAEPGTPEPLTAAELQEFQSLDAKAVHELNNEQLADCVQLGSRLRASSELPPSPADLAGRWATKSLGQAYRGGAWSFDTKEADCVTFTERCIALACARDWPTYYRILQCLRYKDGVVDVLEKNFFPLADWVPNNAWLLDDLTDHLSAPVRTFNLEVDRRGKILNTQYGTLKGPVAPEHAIQFAASPKYDEAAARAAELQEKDIPAVAELQRRGDTEMWIVLAHYPTHAHAVAALPAVRKVEPRAKLTQASLATGKAEKLASLSAAPELIPQRYISRAKIPMVADALRTGDVFLVIRRPSGVWTTTKLYCDHMGLIVRTEGGELTAVHCIPKAVRQEPLAGLLDRCDWIMGMKFLRLNANASALVERELEATKEAMFVPSPETEDQKLEYLRSLRAKPTTP